MTRVEGRGPGRSHALDPITQSNPQEDGEVHTSLDRIDESPSEVQQQCEVTPTPVSSYVALVNPDEGTSLKYVQAPLVNGWKYAKLEP